MLPIRNHDKDKEKTKNKRYSGKKYRKCLSKYQNRWKKDKNKQKWSVYENERKVLCTGNALLVNSNKAVLFTSMKQNQVPVEVWIFW